MADYDLIVVGGGPGGATTARRAALDGLKVLLLDKEKFPRYKACAGAIPGTCAKLLDFPIDSVIHRRISGMAFFAPSGYRIDFVPEERSLPGYTVMRDEFDRWLGPDGGSMRFRPTVAPTSEPPWRRRSGWRHPATDSPW